MATVAMALLSERWLDQVVLSASAAEPAGDISDDYTIPIDLGDLAIIEIFFSVSVVATAIANPELAACTINVNNGVSNVDIVGVENFRRTGAAVWACYFSPDPLVYVRKGERLRINHIDMDANGAPTVVGNIVAKFVRVRQSEIPPLQGPIQLVR